MNVNEDGGIAIVYVAIVTVLEHVNKIIRLVLDKNLYLIVHTLNS